MRTLTESIFGMVLCMVATPFIFFVFVFAIDGKDWARIAVYGIGLLCGVFGTWLNYRSAVRAERTLRHRTDINITIEHKDDTDRPTPAEQ